MAPRDVSTMSPSSLRQRTAGAASPIPGELAQIGTPLLEQHKSAGEEPTDEELDDLLERATRMGGAGAGPIIRQYNADARWIWAQVKGTVIQYTWRPMLLIVLAGAGVTWSIRTHPAGKGEDWPLLGAPPADHPLVQLLKPLDAMWSYQLSFATFILSIFLGHSYGFWLATKGNVRKIQGRLNDLSMLLATHAARDAKGAYTAEAEAMLAETARHVRLFHLFFWAGCLKQTHRDVSDKRGSYAMLKSDKGLRRLVQAGELAEAERAALASINAATLPAGLRHCAALEWLITAFAQARQSGLLNGGAGMESTFLDKACLLRATCATIPDDMSARVPVAYVHLVQMLVDLLLVASPFALYPRLGPLSMPLCALLTFFFRGLLELSKSFLDPFGNDETVGNNFRVDTLVGEQNAGSLRWKDGGARLPFPTPQLVAKRGLF